MQPEQGLSLEPISCLSPGGQADWAFQEPERGSSLTGGVPCSGRCRQGESVVTDRGGISAVRSNGKFREVWDELDTEPRSIGDRSSDVILF
jgi:hypothetical protein